MRRKLFTLAAGASAVLCARVTFRSSFTFAAGTSVVLCSVVCVLWVRSCWVVDHVQLETPAREYYACSYRGSFIVGTISSDELVFPPQPVLTYEALAADRFNDWSILEHLDGNPDVLSWLPHGQAVPAWAVGHRPCRLGRRTPPTPAPAGLLPRLRLRPPRHARKVPGMRGGSLRTRLTRRDQKLTGLLPCGGTNNRIIRRGPLKVAREGVGLRAGHDRRGTAGAGPPG
jgi:hypothetical protein